MQDLFSGIRDSLDDLWSTVTSHLPYGFGDKVSYAVPILTAGISAVAIVVCLQANTGAASINEQAAQYQRGQEQLSRALGESEDVGLSVDSEAVMGRTDLILQYNDLAALDGESAFTQMEKMANVSEDAEEQAADDAVSAVYNSIYNFAGSFGGALIRDADGNTNVRLAAYEDESDMEAPDDSSVSNVLVKQIRRTIESDTYGERDTTNTLTILSGNDIDNFSRIQEGSIMYLLLGRSTGNKSSNMYVCTGIEPGTLEDASGLADNTSDSMTDDSTGNEEETDAENIGLSTRRGTDIVFMPLTSGSSSSSATTGSDGSVTYSDGTKVQPDGTVVYSDGTTVSPDGTVTYPDGMTIRPDGTISGASRGGSQSSGSDSGNSSGNSSSSSSGSNSGSSSGGNSSGSNGDEDSVNSGTDGAPADADLPEVRTGGGILVENDKEHDVILYSINTRTGSVTITYWDAAADS